MANPGIEIIREEFERRKAKNPQYSLRAFSKYLQVSPAQLTQVLNGKRPLTVKVAKKAIVLLGLSSKRRHKVLTSVSAFGFSKATKTSKHLLKSDEFKLISDWYHFAILSLSRFQGARLDIDWISSMLLISKKEAKEALHRLLRLNIIEINGKSFRQITNPINVVSETPNEAIQRYHTQVLDLALKKLFLPPKERDYSAITLAVESKQLPEMRKFIEEFQDEFIEKFSSSNPDSVYKLACQVFPTTKKEAMK